MLKWERKKNGNYVFRCIILIFSRNKSEIKKRKKEKVIYQQLPYFV